MPIVFAVIAAFCFATAAVLFTRGIATNSLSVAGMFSLPFTVLVTGTFAIFDWPDSISATAVWWFVAGGLVGDGLGRATFVSAVDRLGPSTATPIQTAAYPAIALLGGVLFLSETVSPFRIIGAGLIVAGVWAVTLSPRVDTQPSSSARRLRIHWAYMLPVAAGVTFGVSDILRKLGLEENPHPAFGAAIGSATAALVWSIAVVSVRALRHSMRPGIGWGWFVGAGLFVGLALVATFTAFEGGDVSVVGPIILAQPIAVVALSALLLREHEVLSRQLVIGAVVTVAGVISLSLTV